jgi:fibronectin type 3 domain-containing protein
MKKTLPLCALLMVGLFALSCENKIKESTGPPLNLNVPPTPKSISLEIGDRTIRLNWNVDSLNGIAYFKIYRSDSSGVDPELYDSTASATTSFTDSGLKNGSIYTYQVSSVSTSGLGGYKSVKVSAVPNLYALVINNDAKYTNNRTVSLSLTGAINTRHVIISEDSTFADASWQTFSGSKSFTLSFGDGTKYVYVRFKDQDGNETFDKFWDEIILDTQASINSVTENTLGQPKQAGNIIHLLIVAGEPEGTARIDFGSIQNLTLYDDGTHGDGFINDGNYELDYVVPSDVELQDAVVTGKFTDAAGNQAPTRTAFGKVTILKAPEPVNLLPPFGVPGSFSSITLNWSQSSESDFAAYRVYRSTSSGVGLNSELVNSITSRTTTTYTDTVLNENTWYHYRIFVFDANNLSNGSNEDSTRTNVNLPPTAVVLATPSRVDSTSLSLNWTQNGDTDFSSYRVYRDTTATVTTADDLATIINQAGTTTYTDKNLNAGKRYYYSVLVYDKQGLFTPSNIQSAVP